MGLHFNPTQKSSRKDPVQQANSHWQQRVGTQNNNTVGTISFSSQQRQAITAQYQQYCQECYSNGQQPMSMAQFTEQLINGQSSPRTTSMATDPMAALNSGMETGQSLGASLKELFSFGKAKDKGGNDVAELQQYNATAMNELKTKGEVEVNDVNKFVEAQMAALGGDGESVSTAKLTQQFSEIFIDEDGNKLPEEMLNEIMNSISGGKETVSKGDLTKLYNRAKEIGDGKIGPDTILKATSDASVDELKMEMKLEAKGYELTEKDGVLGYTKTGGDGTFIPATDTKALQSLIDE